MEAAKSGRYNNANSQRRNCPCGTCNTWCIAQCALEMTVNDSALKETVSDFGGSKIHKCGPNHNAWSCSTKRASKYPKAAVATRYSPRLPTAFSLVQRLPTHCSVSHWALAMQNWLRSSYLSGSMALR